MHRILAFLLTVFTLAQLWEWCYNKYREYKDDSDYDDYDGDDDFYAD